MAKFEISPTPLAGVLVVRPQIFEDARGFFMESYSKSAFRDAGLELTFVQDNHSLSRAVGVLRGLHYQLPPFAQDKLVRCVRGKIWDVAVDLRRSSATFGQSFGIELSAENHTQLLVPVGFAHGFVTLEPNTEVCYKVTTPYAADCDAGVRWDDLALAVSWPAMADDVILSQKDQALPSLDGAKIFE